ncbi:Phd finger protein [Thalictrum thalictroides]|uniref:Phd finger protein n=1 Tax=Thalictrum thalictroides TaxID=46969 RepID=A0A7J6WLN7_THATH|nr:Phd finger protein [Thalictrum thalictroides]
MSNNLGSQDLSFLNNRVIQMAPTLSNPGSQQIPNLNKRAMSNALMLQHMQNKQATPGELMSNNLGSQDLAFFNNQVTQMVPTFSNPGSQQIPNPNKRMTQMLSMPKNLGPQQSSVLGKRMTHVKSMPTSLGLHQSSAPNKRNAQIEPSPKAQAESSESVRVKLRESLADALALVCKQQNETVKNNSENETASTLKPCSGSPDLADIALRSANARGITPENSLKDDSAQKANTSQSTLDEVLVNDCKGIAAPSVKSEGQDFQFNYVIPENSLKDDNAQKANTSQSTLDEVLANDSKGIAAPSAKSEGQDYQFNYVLLDEDASFGNNFFVKDELLQGNGLCWVSDLEVQAVEPEESPSAKRPKFVHEEVDGDRKSQPSSHDLATQIEAELFKLYDGINKKYKEKGRSLLFNLKDPGNPELRERVMSGEITPERLCSMTPEDLASKERRDWRIAQAEIFEQKVVLPDSGVDVRRLVKKTHKGEFQVEIEQDDGVSVDFAAGASSIPQFQPKSSEREADGASKPIETLNVEGGADEKIYSEDHNLKSSLTTLPDDGTDLMQGLMVDELKDAEFLPPIVSLDEFMESLDSEPPFENLPIDSEKANLESDEKDNPHVGAKLESSEIGSADPVDTAIDKVEKSELKCSNMDSNLKLNHIEEKAGTTKSVSAPKQDMTSSHTRKEVEKSSTVSTPKRDHIWEGVLQLNVSSGVSVIGNFKSGERTSAKEWASSLDVKGRVRLDAFEKFLQELPMSRSRAIMVVHFSRKEGTPESERVHLCEVVDSYVADERVGFAAPAQGVELYLCPPNQKMSEMLAKHLSKDHLQTLNSINDGLIGIVVWRKAHVTSIISPDSSSHHKHNAKRQHSSVRRHQEKNTTPKFPLKSSLSRGPRTHNPEPPLDDDPIDDVPPGFGPAAAAARDEDDLPEFDFTGGSKLSASHLSTANRPKGAMTRSQPPVRPVEQMRQLIHKYGGGEMTNRSVGVDDDDDIPEWQPQSLNQPIIPQQKLTSLPPPPLPSPPLAQHVVHGFQQQSLPTQMISQPQHFPHVQMPVQTQYLQYSNSQLEPTQPVPIQHVPMQGQPNVTSPWHSWPSQSGPPGQAIQGNGLMPNMGVQPVGQVYTTPAPGFVAGQNGMEWRLEVNKSRGF